MNAPGELAGATNNFQRSVTAAGILYGITGVVAGVGVLLRQRWSVKAATAWGVVTTYCGTGAVAAYGGSRSIIEIGATFLILSLVCLGVIWATRIATR